MTKQQNAERSTSLADSVATDLSLLRRVRQRDQLAWDRFVVIYGPMVYEWARKEGLQPADAGDVTQEVFQGVLDGLGRWQPGHFRGWLWTIFRRRVMDHYRRTLNQAQAAGGSTAHRRIQHVAETPPDEASQEGNAELQHLRRRALEIVRDKIPTDQWQAFYRTVIRRDTPANVAADLGISKWAVYKAKTRVLRRLLREFEELDFLPEFTAATRPAPHPEDRSNPPDR